MIVDLNSFDRETEVDCVIPGETVELAGERLRLTGDPAVNGLIEKQDQGVRLRASIVAAGEIDCDRCLEPVRLPFAVKTDVEFLPAEALLAERESEIDQEGLKASLLEGDSLDLAKIVREQLLLETPLKILCRDDCKGICQTCGANLNLMACSCSSDEIDPRWAALKNLN